MRKIWEKALAFMLVLAISVSVVNVPVYAQATTEVQSTETVTEESTVDTSTEEQIQSVETVSGNEAVTTAVESQSNGWDGVTTQQTYEGDNYKIIFMLDGYWNGGYNAKVKIQNTSNVKIENWYMAFDLANEISNLWNAEISTFENDNYVLKNAGYNQDIAANGTVEFGFGAREDFRGFPTECALLGEETETNEEDYTINYHLDSDWGDGFTGTITITNNSEQAIEDWRLEFDFARNITGIWNGVIESHEGNHYVIKNAGYNANIAPGQMVSFGFNGTEGEANAEPINFVLYSIGNILPEEAIDEDCLIVTNALSKLNVEFAFGDTKDSVTSNLNLCNSLDGASVEWTSNNTNIIDNNGVVTRPSDTSEYVTLTAKVSSNEYSDIKEFELYVIKNTYVNYNVDYIEDLDSLEMLYLYNDGEPENLEVYLNDAGYISYISGSFSDFVVESPEEAILALYGIKSLTGINSPKEELRWLSTTKDNYGTSFRYEQIYNNVPVYGMNIVITVDSTGKTSSLYSSFSADINIDTVPTISEKDVTDFLMSQGYSSIEENRLYVYMDDFEPKLVWGVNAIYEDNLYMVLVDAHNGGVVFTNLLSISEFAVGETSASGTSSLGSNENFSVAYFKLGKTTYYTLRDVNRQISVYDATGINNTSSLPGTLISNTTNTWTGGEVSALTNVAKSYDFYYNNYGRKGMDGNNSPISVSINYGQANSFSLGNSWGLVFGQGGTYIYGGEAALDTVGHEYTHSVVRSVTSLGSYYKDAPGAINEGYADIFGYFIENDNDPDWRHREDNTVSGLGIRNMSNPAAFNQPSKIGDSNYYDFTIAGNTRDNGGVHVNNTIVSHACYLMWRNGITDKQRLADLWYHALLLGYDGNSTFNTVRLNVLTSAKNMRMSADEIKIIKDAFDAVGIVGLTKADINGTNILTGKVVVADDDMVLGNNKSLPDAKIQLARVGTINDGSNFFDNYKNAFSEKDGTFSMINIIPGTYKLTISKSGYYTATQYITLTATKINNYCSTTELIPVTYTGVGGAKGSIVDAITGDGVEGLTLRIRKGINAKSGTVIDTLTSGTDGEYSISDLTSGHYCIEIVEKRNVEGDKYLTTYFNIKVLGGKVISNQNATVSTTLNESQLRIVLEWGAKPNDLDSHLFGPTSSGSQFHIYYINKSYSESGKVIADLDLDDVTSYGPETTTIYNPIEGIYTFYIYNYSGSPEMSTSGASVRVYTGNSNEPAYVFNIPVDTSGRYWTVFTYNSKTRKITPVNVVGSSVVK